MKIYDFVKCSFVDYPGKIAAVVFTRGCTMNCRYCHNAHIIPLEGPCNTDEHKLFEFLKKRSGILQGVVVTGGEPTVQPDLLQFLAKIRALSTYSIKLDTNGLRPDVIKKAIDGKLVDYIAMDIKAPKKKYEKITQIPYNDTKIQTSINLIQASGLPHQFRTTYDKRFLTEKDLLDIRKWIKDDDNYVVNECILRDSEGNPIPQ